ncbi:hypothetical protein ACH4C6_02745 [Streptomyces sp. NPDC017943]|uniref:hypothetical protein n=1 Tax=Streptomyces sp. NPDC017943 TaxID=3365019 RepID=UPI00378ED538
MSRETDTSSSGPNGRGGAAYPSGTPPYGTPVVSDDGTDAGRSATRPEERKTETTLTTRIRINIPGSRPIPPVVMRKPVTDTDASGDTDAGAATPTPAGLAAPQGAGPAEPPAAEPAPPADDKPTSDWFAPRKSAPAKGGPGGGAPNGTGAPGGSGPAAGGSAPGAPTSGAPGAGAQGSGAGTPGGARPGAGRPGGVVGSMSVPGGSRSGGTNGSGLPGGATGGPVAPGHGGGTGSFDVTEALTAGGSRPAPGNGDARRDELPYFSENGSGPAGPTGGPVTGDFAGQGAPGGLEDTGSYSLPDGPDAYGAHGGFDGPGGPLGPEDTGAFSRPDALGGADAFDPQGGPGRPGGSGVPGGFSDAPNGTGGFDAPRAPGGFGEPRRPGGPENFSDPGRPGAPGGPGTFRDAGGPGAPTGPRAIGGGPGAPTGSGGPTGPAPAGGPTAPGTAGPGGGLSDDTAVLTPQKQAPEPPDGQGYPPRHDNVSGHTVTSGMPVVTPGTGSPFGPGTPGDGPAPRTAPKPAPVPPSPATSAKAPKKKGRNKLVLLVAGLVVAAGGLYGAGLLMNRTDVPKGTTVLGVDIGGTTRDGAVKKLDAAFEEQAGKPLKLSVAGRTVSLDPDNAGLQFDMDATADTAAKSDYNPVSVIGSLFGRHRVVTPVMPVDEEKLHASLQNAAGGSGASTDGTITFKGGKAVPVYGKPGKGVDLAKSTAAVEQAYRAQVETGTAGTVALPTTTRQPTVSDAEVDRVLKEIAQPAMSDLVTVRTDAAHSIDFGPVSLPKILSFKAVDGKLQDTYDLKALRAAYGQTFEGVQIEGASGKRDVTPQDVVSALREALRGKTPAERVGVIDTKPN